MSELAAPLRYRPEVFDEPALEFAKPCGGTTCWSFAEHSRVPADH
ncbi:MAG: hypothetical protein FD138_3147, partial [Planctomycetota bacterium]